jgi:hypothetical protein
VGTIGDASGTAIGSGYIGHNLGADRPGLAFDPTDDRPPT